MKQPIVVGACRAPIGTLLSDPSGISGPNLGTVAMRRAVSRSGFAPHERLNVHKGVIPPGHPIIASGARVLVTLLHAMEHRDAHHGLVSLCLGGGNAVAMIVERMA